MAKILSPRIDATTPKEPLDPYRGLSWHQDLFNFMPKWTYKPGKRAIAQTIKSCYPPGTNISEVKFLAKGAYNRVYEVLVNNEPVIMRISLPMEPVYKTLSEVATVEWVRTVTDIPLPKIINYDLTRESPIGFEWVLMSKMPGKHPENAMKDLSFSQKTALVKQLAQFQACLWRNQLRGIGNIYPSSAEVKRESGSQSSSSHYFSPKDHAMNSLDFSFSLASQLDGASDGPFCLPSETKLPQSSDPCANPRSNNVEHDQNMPIHKLGGIVSPELFPKYHTRNPIDRGPFHSSQDWIEARLAAARRGCKETLANYDNTDDSDGSDTTNDSDSDTNRTDDNDHTDITDITDPADYDEHIEYSVHSDDSDDNDDSDDSITSDDTEEGEIEHRVYSAEGTLRVIEKLEHLVPHLFPKSASGPEPTMIFHQDIHEHNIFLNENGKLIGVIDWECVSALPLWKACYYPRLLHGKPRTSPPEFDPSYSLTDDLYLENLENYEKTCLRKIFIEEMRSLEPGWVSVFDSSSLQRDFDVAIMYLDISLVRTEIETWAEAVANGVPNPSSLSDSFSC